MEDGFTYSGDRPRRWKDTSDLWVHGYWSWDWANSYERVASIDLDHRLVKTAPPYGLYGFRKGQRFYFLNVLEELDQPGEWFLDRKTGMLYFWPPKPIRRQRETFLSLLGQPLIRLTDVSHVTFRGLILEATRGNAVEIHGGASNRIAGCLIRNIGNYGVTITGGTGHGVAGCDIFDTGDGGVSNGRRRPHRRSRPAGTSSRTATSHARAAGPSAMCRPFTSAASASAPRTTSSTTTRTAPFSSTATTT